MGGLILEGIVAEHGSTANSPVSLGVKILDHVSLWFIVAQLSIHGRRGIIEFQYAVVKFQRAIFIQKDRLVIKS